MRELSNEQWGFSSNCFVCERSNERGLRIPFFHDSERDVVTAEFSLSSAFSGAPSYAHGGIRLAVCDEAMAWATIAIAHRFAMTRDCSARFARPVLVDRLHRVEVRLTNVDAKEITATASVLDDRGRHCMHAEATFVPLGEAQAARAAGAQLTGDAAHYVEP